MPDMKINTSITSSVAIPASDVDLIALVRAVNAFHAVVPLTKFHVKETATPGVFSYAFHAADGRTWNQIIYGNIAGGNPTYDFNCVGWPEDQFVLQRPVRDLVKKLLAEFGLTEYKTTFPG